jgi:hypothetical protein
VFEKRVLRRIYAESERDEVARGWSKLNNEELHKLYSSPYIIRVMKSEGMKWAGHVARIEGMRNAYDIHHFGWKA